MSTTTQTTHRRNIKSNVAKANQIYLNAENTKAVRECAKKLGKDESFVVNSLLRKIDFVPLVEAESLKNKAVNDAVSIKSITTKVNQIYLNAENTKAVRECAKKSGKDENSLVNSLLEKIHFLVID